MENEKVSKVAICERCGCFVKACHKDHLSKSSEKDFTDLSNAGFTIKFITVAETIALDMGMYSECSKLICKEKS